MIGTFTQKVEINVSHMWKDTKTRTHTVEQSVSEGVDVTVPARTKTFVFIKQTQASLLFQFEADLTAGVANTAQPLKTSMARSLGISAARNHPCIGYLAGNSPNSLMGLNAYARSRGITPETTGLPEDQRAFLEAAPSLTVSSTDRCPGFPVGFPASFGFNGTAAYAGEAGGPTGPGSFAPKLPAIDVCRYDEPPPEPPSPDGACGPAGSPPPASSAGDVIDAGEIRSGLSVKGNRQDDLILTDCRHRNCQTGPGDDVVQPDGLCQAPERIVVGGGEDIVTGNRGNDTLIGGAGSDYLAPGGGNNTLVLSAFGSTEARGGPGENRFIVLSQPVADPALAIGMRLSNLPLSAMSADTIDDFHPGDRLVLSTRSFGTALGSLRRDMRITVGASARGPGAQLVFSPARGFLSFDPDGQGGAPAAVVAILKGVHRLPASAIQIVS